MRKLRVLVVTADGLIPPDDAESDPNIDSASWKMEYDIIGALERLNHQVQIISVYDNLAPIRESIQEYQPHIVFNLVHEFHGIAVYDHNIAGYLELLKQPYTGCNPRGLMISRDKVLAKKLMHYHRIATPRFVVMPRDKKFRAPQRLQYPLLVKSTVEEASLAISQASVVSSVEKLKERVEFIHEQVGSNALVEEYIDGRELYIGVIGNNRLEALPAIEISFADLSETAYPIATRKVKWDEAYRQKYNIDSAVAKNLPESTVKQIQTIAKKIYRTLFLTGYARMDCRLRADGKLFCLEANANADLSLHDEFALSAEQAGYNYEQLVQKILTLGLSYNSEWKQQENSLR